MKLNINNLQTGDVFIKLTNGVYHYALGMRFNSNHFFLAENQKGYGVRYVSMEEFLQEGILIKVEQNHFNYNTQDQIKQRVQSRLGISYSLLDYNCEHFVNDVLTGVSESKQIQTVATIGLGIALFLLARRG